MSPTPVCTRTHNSNHVRALKILYCSPGQRSVSHYGNTNRPSMLLNQLGLGGATLLQLAFLEDSDPDLSMGESPIGTAK